MDRPEKLRLSADAYTGHSFQEGLFMRLYEKSLYWFVTHVRPLKVLTQTTKKGVSVVYGGLPVSSFKKLVREGKLTSAVTEGVQTHWSYKQQAQGSMEDFMNFPAWRQAALAEQANAQGTTSTNRDILHEIRTFALSDCTPIQAIHTIHEWREYLLHSGKE